MAQCYDKTDVELELQCTPTGAILARALQLMGKADKGFSKLEFNIGNKHFNIYNTWRGEVH